MEKLNVILATYNNRAENLRNVLQKPKEYVTYIISHQVTEPLNKETLNVIEWLKERKDVIYSRISSKGVAKNRNNALKLLPDKGIALCADDDVSFLNNTFERIILAFKHNEKADILTFKIQKFNGRDFKRYKKVKFRHNLFTIFPIGTIEVAFRIEQIKKQKIKFDERFGPGSSIYPIGEDFIFIGDAVRKKLKCYYLPIPILKHPDFSTGDKLDETIIYSRGAIFARVFGKYSFIIDILFGIKKYFSYKTHYSILKYIKLMLEGSKSFLKTY